MAVPAQRELIFSSLDDVMPEVERLLAGHACAGEWSLGQICHHLAVTIHLTARPASDVTKGTPDQAALREKFFSLGRFPPGRSAPPAIAPAPGLEDAEEAERLRKAIERFATAAGPFPGHPVLGPLSRDEWNRFHVLHAAHHLGFAAPIG